MSSCSEVSEVTPADIGLESTEESTDTSTVELAISRARDSRGQKHNKSCLPHGYVPQVLYKIQNSKYFILIFKRSNSCCAALFFLWAI